MLYLFDLDNTLISSYLDTPEKDYNDWHVLPGRREKLEQLRNRGHAIAIVTNQRGIAFGYTSIEQYDDKVLDAIGRLGLSNPRSDGAPAYPFVYVCPSDVRGKPPYNDPNDAARAKPSGAMIREAMEDHPQDTAEGVLMVGDRQEDYDAAKNAGVPFQWAHVFFGA
jgi:D-glycero-D-manno-heptose 1,7-bisphosphate phosphatase